MKVVQVHFYRYDGVTDTRSEPASGGGPPRPPSAAALLAAAACRAHKVKSPNG